MNMRLLQAIATATAAAIGVIVTSSSVFGQQAQPQIINIIEPTNDGSKLSLRVDTIQRGTDNPRFVYFVHDAKNKEVRVNAAYGDCNKNNWGLYVGKDELLTIPADSVASKKMMFIVCSMDYMGNSWMAEAETSLFVQPGYSYNFETPYTMDLHVSGFRGALPLVGVSPTPAMVQTVSPVPTQLYAVPHRGGSGRCNVPSDRDSRGRRCGGRAASVRPGGR